MFPPDLLVFQESIEMRSDRGTEKLT